jgi:hypothetical protein
MSDAEAYTELASRDLRSFRAEGVCCECSTPTTLACGRCDKPLCGRLACAISNHHFDKCVGAIRVSG